MPRPPNPRRTTLGPVSMNSSSSGTLGRGGVAGTGGNPMTGTGALTPSKIPKPRKGRQSMLPRVGRENTISPSGTTGSTGSATTGTVTTNLVPPSPSNSVTSVSSYSRRSTMGGHGRMSMGGGGGGSSGRPSLAGGSSNGTGSGTGASTSNSVVKQDPRPIQDKNYQQHCIRTLLMFLTKSGYEYPVNLKSLVRPSGKDFTHIVTFLLKQVDPTFGTTDLKMEEEVAMHFKALGYPYPVSKTALVAAGSPHTWPSLLAALVWLVEHIVVLNVSVEEEAEVNYETSAKFESLAELETKTDKAFFQYLHRAYAAFLEGSVEKSDLLVENLVDMFEEDNNVIEREIERVTDLNATMVEKIHLLQQQSESLPILMKKRESYATDLEQFHDLVRQMDDHCTTLALKVQERMKELQQTHDDLEGMTTKMENLQRTVATQPLSVEQLQKMHAEQARLKEALEKASALKHFNMDGLDKSQQELNTLWEDLEMLMREYNEEAAELLRNMADFAQQLPSKMTLQKDQSTDQTQLVGVDISNQLVPFLEHCKDRNTNLLGDTRRQLETFLDDAEAIKEAYTEAMDRNKIIEVKVSKLDEVLATEVEQQEATLSVRLREVESIDLKIESLSDPASLEEQICAYQRQCDTLERLRSRHEEETTSQKNSIHQEIQDAIVAVEEHNRFVTEKLEELKAYADGKKNSVRVLA